MSRIFWIRNPDELLTFIWISFFFSGGSKSTQTRQRSSAGKRRWSRSKFHAAMVEPLYHIVITVWYCKNRCYKKEINKNLVVPNPMPIRTPNFSINHDNLLFLILAAPKKKERQKIPTNLQIKFVFSEKSTSKKKFENLRVSLPIFSKLQKGMKYKICRNYNCDFRLFFRFLNQKIM